MVRDGITIRGMDRTIIRVPTRTDFTFTIHGTTAGEGAIAIITHRIIPIIRRHIVRRPITAVHRERIRVHREDITDRTIRTIRM